MGYGLWVWTVIEWIRDVMWVRVQVRVCVAVGREYRTDYRTDYSTGLDWTCASSSVRSIWY
jgi:hypothetical protein